MNSSQATVNPSRGTIRILVSPGDEGADLPTEHDLAPWPVDQYCHKIASDTLAGMGWTVTKAGTLPEEPDGDYVLDVAPAS